jgi:hypothetical protein
MIFHLVILLFNLRNEDMPFDKRNVILGRGTTNNNATPNGVAIHTYYSDVDNAAAIFTGGYFDAYLGATSDDVVVNDILWVRDSSGDYETYAITSANPLTISSIEFSETFQNLTVSGSITFPSTAQGIFLPTFGGTSTALNYNSEFVNAIFEFGASPWASSAQAAIKARRTQEDVRLVIEGKSFPATSADFISSTSTLPVEFRPSVDMWGTLPIINNGNPAIGKVKVTTVGTIQIFSDAASGDFATPGNAGWNTSVINYFVNLT